MDDEIEIEEHDILEHPLVKAVFPDLSKLKIQVHTEEYDASLLHYDDSNLLEEIPNCIESNYETGEENYEKEFLDEEPDKASHDDCLEDEGNMNNSSIQTDNINETVNGQVDIVQEISDDEPEVPKEIVTNVAEEVPTNVQQHVVNSKSLNSEETVNYVEISDDEEQKNINGENVDCIDDDKVTTEIEIAEDDETQKNGDDSLVNENSDTKNIRDLNEECMIDDQSVATEVSHDKENREAIVDESDGVIEDLLDENQNSPLESIQDSEKSVVPDENIHEDHQMACDEYITSDLLGEDVNRHKRVQEENPDSMVNSQHEVDEMETEISNEIYTETSIKQEIEDVPIKEEIMDDFDAEEYNFDESVSEMGANSNVTPTFNESTDYIPNKIILGTKPSPVNVPHVKDYTYLVVSLEDWGEHLNQSPCYCVECKILFTTPNALDYHKMSAHSLLAPIINRAVKSTAKSLKPNVAKKSTSAIDLENSRHCSHCNVNFKDNTALIKHLYELLPQQYNCNVCSETFNNQTDLANHSTVHVKIEPRKILKAKKNLDNPMLRSLLKQKIKIPVKAKNTHSDVEVPVKIKIEPVDNSGIKFKCMICSDIFITYRLARKHREVHPEKKNQMIFKKIISNSKLKRTKDKLVFEDEKPIKKHKLTKDPCPSKSDDSKTKFDIVPKSALFQCPKCCLHFTSTTAGIAHMGHENCDPKSKTPKWTCPTCKKIMRIKDTEIHIKQHQLSSKLKIYKLTKNTYERTLCKCLKCNVHFEYIALKMHLKKCGKIPTAKCQKCNILLMKSKLLGHMTKHNILKLKPKDFTLVEYMIASDINKNIKQEKSSAKSAVSSSSDVDIKKPLIIKTKPGVELGQTFLNVDRVEKTKIKKFKMYFCKNCEISLTHIRNPESHLAKKCVVYSKQSCVCDKCGLFLPWNTKQSHFRLHQQKNFSLNDVQFFDIVTRKPIALPILNYASCSTCKIHFLTKGDRRKHICGEDYENCEYCGDMFEIKTLKIHRQFHQVRKLINKPKIEKPKPESSKWVIPELMMKYESLNPIWNILFICSKCELVTDMYNKAVEHSQDHIKRNYKKPKSVTCYICNLIFDETSWAKHKELHTQMSIKRKSFKLLTYTPENLLEESWFQMFESVPEKEIRQIIDQSVFGGERSLKMKLMKHGLPEFTLYCCSNCKVCYDTNNLTAHVNVKCKVSKYRCNECELAFENESTLTFHKLLHERGIKKEEFRIIQFIKTTQTVKSNSDKNHAESSKNKVQEKELKPLYINGKVDPRAVKVLMEVRDRVSNDEIDFEKPLALNPRAQYSLHRCIKCSACVLLGIHRNKHKCALVNELYYCTICKQNVSIRRKGNHKAEHEMCPNFKPKNTIIFEFNADYLPQSTRKYKKSGLHVKKKCKNLKIISSKAKPKKVTKKVIATSSKPSNVKRANSVESFENFVNTITSDSKTEYANPELNSTQESCKDQTKRRSYKLYKCNCGLHYTSIKTIEKHMKTCNNGIEISTDNCSKCGLLFPTEVLVTHLCKHHSLASVDTDITVEEVKEVKNKTTSSKTDINTGTENNAGETDSTEEKTIKNNTSESDICKESVKDKKKPRDYIKIYKCGECKVHYLNQNTCYKHAYKNHVKIDSKRFIDCKVCGLAFTLASLQLHITRHHKTDLDLDKVLVEEYHPNEGKGALKIDIYYASEKVQNLQVSSSND